MACDSWLGLCMILHVTIKVVITVGKNISRAILVEDYSLSNGWQ